MWKSSWHEPLTAPLPWRTSLGCQSGACRPPAHLPALGEVKGQPPEAGARMNRLQDNLELKNRTAWTSVTIHTQTWSSEILPMQTEPWEHRSGNSASLQLQVSKQSGQTDKYIGFGGDILTITMPIGGKDASIVIIGRGRLLHKA